MSDGPVVLVAALWLALAVDRWLGEPPARLHPVVGMGAWLAWAGRHAAPLPGDARRAAPFVRGALAWLVGAFVAAALGQAVQEIVKPLPTMLAALGLALCLKPLLAWRMLRDEVAAVELALGRSLAEGREGLARLVSRDVQRLDAGGVRESAIESLAENLNDSLVAPLFWFAIAGLPGAALYRFANTADAMWGYRGERGGRDWTWAGKWAARADDVLSWVPARLTALLLMLAAGYRPAGLRQEAARTPSPNGGWPMGAMALLLGVHLRKPGVYTLHPGGRAPQAQDTHRALVFAGRATFGAGVLTTLALAVRGWTW
ncbi:adenosylcobinamide-phosphate synthase CbiB [uncultured Pseudacidovorax sp.]|uniref:adenosylcobinamide-phosphate synthase CbiB n=1 Tax=uncultured Pseudacidovorax sp. TaxID=679313 RepID=UPI0025DC3A72|nr:adenosylcobinamide-phosphate synthase CbiB [uncultured Pseudacidovorax sp.]